MSSFVEKGATIDGKAMGIIYIGKDKAVRLRMTMIMLLT